MSSNFLTVLFNREISSFFVVEEAVILIKFTFYSHKL